MEKYNKSKPSRQYDGPSLEMFLDFISLINNDVVDDKKRLKYKIIYLLCFCAGLRLSEALSLRPQHIDLDSRTVRVIEGKGARDRTSIYANFHSDLQFKEAYKEYLPLGSKIKSSVQKYFNKMSVLANWNYERDKFKTKSGKERVKYFYSVHCLRHSYALRMLDNGIPINIVQSLLGHKHIATTNVYSFIRPKFAMDLVKEKGL